MLDHLTADEFMKMAAIDIDYSDITVIFYDLELLRDGEIEQIGAWSESNRNFSSIWMNFVAQASTAIRHFITWINSQYHVNTHRDTCLNKIMLAADNGGCHDHLRILRMVLKHGVDPPNYKFVDTLAMFRAIKDKNVPASLLTSRDMYIPWIAHTPPDTDSDAEVLRYLTMYVFPDVKKYCHVFSIDCVDYSNCTGMNMNIPSPVVTPKSSSRPCMPSNITDDMDSEISYE